MRFEISHFTEYHYESPAWLSPHVLRLRPREDGTQRLQLYRMHVEPVPTRISTQVEPDGNTSLIAYFEAPVERLRIHSRANVETRRSNPYDFVVVEPEVSILPAKYSPDLAAILQPSLAPLSGLEFRDLAADLAKRTGYESLTFLSQLNQHLFETMRVVVRPEGMPLPPDQCLADGEGACRDLAVIFMAACREMGLACRFVSGYQMTDPNEEQSHMHAWAEVYLPGGGWRGFDPTHGIAVDEHFVPVAASPIPRLATPVEGTYAPASVPSRMKVSLDVRASSPLILAGGERNPGEVVAP